jgi:hypothetical protein
VWASDRAVNRDPSPAVRIFTVTATTPETRIASGPTSPWPEASVTLELDADVAQPTFECQLDEEARLPCASPVTYDNLSEGAHVFRAWARDGAGRFDPSPAVHLFAVAFGYW